LLIAFLLELEAVCPRIALLNCVSPNSLDTLSLRFPLLAGGTEPMRGSPREAGGT